MRVNQTSSLSTFHCSSSSFSLPSSVMQEAAAWIESLSDEGDEDPMVTGKFTFNQVAIRADLLVHLIRENCVVELSMVNTEISSSGLVALFDALMYSGVTTAMSLDSIDFDGRAWAALTMLMKKSKSIVMYCLGELSIQDDGVAMICDALAENGVIEDLDLWLNGIGVEGARSLAKFLKANGSKSLTTLSLAGNSIGDEGVVALADGMKSNASLRALSVSCCDFSDDGAIALASLLEHGSHLQTLHLQGNEIGEAGWMALANALKHNRNLRYLDFSLNPGEDGEGIENAFIDVFHNNVTLIGLQGSNSSQIEALLRHNKEEIPEAVRRAALLLIGIRRSTDIEGMGDFAVFPKDIVRLIAQTVWETRRDPVWIQAIE